MAPDPCSEAWRPTASLTVLRQRAAILAAIRRFFAERQVLEVETPLLSHAASSEVHLQSLQVSGPSMPATFLHTSPELAMKRLLAAGSGDIYQVCKVFRAAEQGHRHNPEFTLLEWYRVGYDLPALMREVADLLSGVLAGQLNAPPLYLAYRQAFLDHAGLDPLTASTDQLRAVFQARLGQDVVGADDSDWLDLVFSQVVQPCLPQKRLVFISGFPAAQASLARLDAEDPRLACRFEVFVDGLELANGFEELTDSDEQARRIDAEQSRRRETGLPSLPVDQHFLSALRAGLPASSGVAVGVDRVVMLATGQAEIARVLAFDFDRA